MFSHFVSQINLVLLFWVFHVHWLLYILQEAYNAKILKNVLHFVRQAYYVDDLNILDSKNFPFLVQLRCTVRILYNYGKLFESIIENAGLLFKSNICPKNYFRDSQEFKIQICFNRTQEIKFYGSFFRLLQSIFTKYNKTVD